MARDALFGIKTLDWQRKNENWPHEPIWDTGKGTRGNTYPIFRPVQTQCLRETLQIIEDLFVRSDLDCIPKVLPRVFLKLLAFNEQDSAVFRNDGVCEEDCRRADMAVSAALPELRVEGSTYQGCSQYQSPGG